MNNPYTLAFGRRPHSYISRYEQVNSVIESFNGEYPSAQVYMITGVRGSGKTVLMTNIEKELEKDKAWITIELNPETDLLEGLAARLYSRPELGALFAKAEINLSLFGIGVSISNSTPITSIETAIERMLKVLKKEKKKVLVSIDEVTNSKNVKIFASAFQIFMRQEYDIFLLMTGLYEHIYNLQNEDTLTFLYRAPKIHLTSLNIGAIQYNYKEVFNLSDGEATEMAKATKGYAFAYQVLGFIRWENKNKTLAEIYRLYEQQLEDFVYEKIWSELSTKDREVLAAIGSDGAVKTKTIRDKTGMTSCLFSTYRDRLEKKGLIDTSQYGYIRLTLPRFSDFVERRAGLQY
ncbi:MAG: ATP-binding protein [Parasporobacterium sp.]|nr:ATP-binding protein [Parasporobacterium sp.]